MATLLHLAPFRIGGPNSGGVGELLHGPLEDRLRLAVLQLEAPEVESQSKQTNTQEQTNCQNSSSKFVLLLARGGIG